MAVMAQYALLTTPVQPDLHEAVLVPKLIADRLGVTDQELRHEVEQLWYEQFRLAMTRTLHRADLMVQIAKEDK